MNLIKRERDVFTGSSELEDLHCLEKFPIFMGCVDQPRSEDLVADMAWQISRDSGVVQLKSLIPLDVLYQSQHASGDVSAIWMDHHRSLSRFLQKIKPAAVLEIGGAHGILATDFYKTAKIPWTILEPNPTPVAGCEARFIKGFFDEKFVADAPFDTVVHSHVFEHIYEPDKFMGQLSRLMQEGQNLVFSVPNERVMLERKYTNCLNFEHSLFLREEYVEYVLAKHGFRVAAKEYFMENHSVFYAAVRDSEAKPLPVPNLHDANKRIYMAFVEYHEELIRDLNEKIKGITRPLYLFGAHIFAQYLIGFGLDTSKFVSALDNDPKKHGKRLYGTGLRVDSPRVLAKEKDPVVILKAGVYNDEVRADILGNINATTTFLE